jgi:hypothetical protein
MLTKIALLLFILQTSLTPPTDSGLQRSEAINAKLQVNVLSYQLQANNFVEALARVASDFQIPMGIEWIDRPSARAKVSFAWENTTVGKVLQAVVKTQPGFEIVVGASTVHVFSPDLIPASENPLKLHINLFEVHNVPVEYASRQLHSTVKRIMSPAKLPQGIGGVGGSGFSNIDDPKISMQVKNASVEDALNVLTQTSTRKVWVVTFSNNPDMTATGFRRTSTLWNTTRIPDEDQPVWDLLHWSDKPTTVTE